MVTTGLAALSGALLLLVLCELLSTLAIAGRAGQHRHRRRAGLVLALVSALVALVGGGVLVRLAGMRWPSVAGAVLLAAVLAALVPVAVHGLFHRSTAADVLLHRRAARAATQVALGYGAGAVFLLPLLDPVLRGPGPAPWQVLLTAEPLAILVIVWDVGVSLGWGEGWRGLLALLGGAVAGGALLAIGMLFTLAAGLGVVELLAPGIWLGAVGFLIAASGGAFWALTGMPWLPPVVRPAGGWPRPRPARAVPPGGTRRVPGWLAARRSTSS